MLVLRAIGDQEQEAGHRQALDEGVEARLGLGIQPVEVVDDYEQGLRLADTEHEVLDGLERLLAALRGIEGLPLGLCDRHVEERQERWHQRREGRIEAQEPGGNLVADCWRRVARIEVEVRLEQVHDGPIGDRLVVGDHAGVEQTPRRGQMAPHELHTQAGFADARLAHDPHELSASCLHLGHQGTQGRQGTGTPDERRQHACPLETQEAPRRAAPQDRVDGVQRGRSGQGCGLHRGHLHHLGHQAHCGPTAPNGPRGSLGLQGAGPGQRVPHDGTRTLGCCLEQAHRDLPRVDPQAYRQPGARLRAERPPGLVDPPLQLQCRQHSTLRMLFLGQWRPKDGEDLVPSDGLEGASIALHRLPRPAIERTQLAVMRLQLRRGPRGRRDQGTTQDRDELPLPSRHRGVALPNPGRGAGIPLRSGLKRRPGLRQHRGRVRRCLVCGRHRGHKAIALAIDRLQQPLVAPAVPNGLAYRFDHTLERGIADKLLRPDLLTELVL